MEENSKFKVTLSPSVPTYKGIFAYVWMCVGFAYLGVSVVLFLVGRFSPYEWHIDTSGPEPSMKNEFSVWNSLWFTFSTLMQQGCEVAPRAISSRIVASVWYLFTLIMISSYTANLAAFLTAARMNSPINSVEDLAKQTSIKYGTITGGSTQSFFKNSKYPTYKKMWSFMERNPDLFMPSNDAGLARVVNSNGRYAYLVESTFNEYKSNREPCNTMRVGANLNSQGYGIGMPLDSDLKSKINIAILQLRELGKLAELEKKWWREVGNICPEETTDASSTSRLPVNKIEGIFHILAAGVCAGIMVAVCELVFMAKLDAVKSGGTTSFAQSLKTQFELFKNGTDVRQDSQSDDDKLPNQQQASASADGLKFSEASDADGGKANVKDNKIKFLSVDDVFQPASSSSGKTLPSVSIAQPGRQRNSINVVSSTPKEMRSPATCVSAGGASLEAPPPDEFRTGSRSNHTAM